MSKRVLILAFLAAVIVPDCGLVWAQPFQIIICETPMGSGGGQGLRRYIAYDTFGAILQLTPIPGNLVNDPSSVALRNAEELFVGNRAAHSGNSSISRFTLSGSFFEPAGTITGNSVTDCHQLAFDYDGDELFQTNWTTGKLSRFQFDSEGNAAANGYVQMPDGAKMLGVAIRPADRQLFVSDYDFVRRFSRSPDGSYAFISNFSIQSGEFYHFMKFLNDELYLAAFQTNRVLRFSFDSGGNPVLKEIISATGAVDMDFSPDGQEMFVTNHRSGSITRYRYQSETDTWAVFGDPIVTPGLGGIVITPTVCPLQADLTGDCVVNMQDLYVFIDQWMQSVDPYYCTLSGNMAGPDDECTVNTQDFGVFASQWRMIFGGE